MKAFIVWTSIIAFLICLLIAKYARPETASWYSEASTRAEGHTLIMANGEVLNDTRFTGASWDFELGRKIKVINLENDKTVEVEITDRGPAKRLYKMGRILDLSKGAFSKIADLKQGVIPIKIEVLK